MTDSELLELVYAYDSGEITRVEFQARVRRLDDALILKVAAILTGARSRPTNRSNYRQPYGPYRRPEPG